MMTSNRNAEKVFWKIFAFTCPLIPIAVYFNNNWYSLFHSYSVGMVLGLFSCCYFLNTLLLSTRIPYFDHLYGHDRVMVFHGWYAVCALIFAIGHLVFKWIFYLDLSTQVIYGLTGLSLFFIIITLTTLFMIDSLLHRVPAVARLKEFFVTKIHFDYSRLKLVHNFTALAAFLIIVHVYLASSTQETIFRMSLIGVWGGICIILYVYHKVVRPIIAYTAGYTLTQNNPLTPSITELKLHSGKRVPRYYKAGQFGYFRLLARECGYAEHPFTISSPPGSVELAITVKTLGDYTAKLHRVPVGTKVLFDGPYGIFTPEMKKHIHIFIAGGIGITPFVSILAQYNDSEIPQAVTLIWTCRTQDEMIHRDFFAAYASRHRLFQFIPVITRERGIDGVRQRIDRQLLEAEIPQVVRKKIRVFLCGPEPLRITVCRELKAMGVPGKNIHYEKFSF